jgi:hypothetical protein
VNVFVLRTLKAPHDLPTSLEVDLTSHPHLRFVADDVALFTLRCGALKTCQVANEFEPAWPALADGFAPSREKDEGPLGAVARELLRVVIATDAELARSKAARQPESALDSRRMSVVSVLAQMPEDVLAPQIIALPRPADLKARLALSALEVRRGRYGDLDDIEDAMLQDGEPLKRLRRFIAYGLSDPGPGKASMKVLARWIKSRDGDVRFHVACALREKRLQESADLLVRHGVRDPDPRVRVQSLLALHDMTGEGPSARPEDLQQDDTAAVRFWLDPRHVPVVRPD